VFIDSAGIDTVPTGIVSNDYGELVVIGNSTKFVDSANKRLNMDGSGIESYLQPAKKVVEKTFLTLFRVSRKGSLVDRKRVTTGDSLFFSDIYPIGINQYRIVGGHAARGGSVTADVQMH
jgi:hypothetical protein